MIKAKRGYWKSYCSEPIDKIEHYEEALAENFKGWCMHHRLEIKSDGTRVSAKELIDKGLYFGRPAEELVFMRREEHISLHSKDKHLSAETRQKISESLKGKHRSEEHSKKIAEANKGKHRSAETRLKMSAALKDRTFSAESRRKMSEAKRGKNHPFFGKHHSEESRKKMSEAVCRMLWWNDGISNKRSKECPGTEWKRGRIRFK